MPMIRVDTVRLNTLLSNIQKQRQAMQQCLSDLNRVRNSLDMQIATTGNIQGSLTSLYRRLQQQIDTLSRYENFVKQVIDQFGAADRRISNQAKEVRYLLNRCEFVVTSNSNRTPSISMLSKYKNIQNLSTLFTGIGVTTVLPLFGTVIPQVWSNLKKERKVLGGFEDISDLYGVFNDSSLMKNLGETAEAVKDTKFFKYIGAFSNGYKLGEAIQSGDSKEVLEFVKKYTGKGVKKITKLSGFEGAGYINLGWNLGENATEGLSKFRNDSPLVGAAKYVWYCTGWTLLETGSEMAYDIVDSVFTIFGGDLDKVYENLTGTPGVEGFYKAIGTFGDYIADYIADEANKKFAAVGDTIADWGKGISDLVKNLF